MKNFIILLFLLSFYLNAETTNKVKVDVFSNEESCWICLQGTKQISELELKNTELEVTMYFCNESKELLNSLLMDYDLFHINTFLDPLYLYPKHYELSSLPAIIIRDTKDSIVLKEKFVGNPQKYIKLIKEIDSSYGANHNKETHNSIAGLEFIKSLTLKDTTNTPIFNNRFDGFYNPNDERYYGVIGKDTKISVFDSNGVLADTINLEQDNIKCFMPVKLQLANDSNIIWFDMHIPDGPGKRFFYSLNLHTKLIDRKIKEMEIDSCHLGNGFIQIPNTNKFVFSVWYIDNTNLDNNSKLFLMLDNGKVSRFGKVDSALSKLKMSAIMWNYISITADNNSNIYSLSPLSNDLFMYNQDGNYLKTIDLEFEDGFLEKPTDLPKDITSIARDYKVLYKLFVLDNDIFVVHSIYVPNDSEFKFRDKVYYLTHFDKNGKRVGKTIQLPTNYQPIYIKDNQLLIQHLNSSSKFNFYWYKIN